MTELERAELLDLIVIGVGPAGLFAAINAAGGGGRVLVLEKKRTPGRKLLISGSGRCNITHDGDIRAFLDRYGGAGRFLRPALLGFTNCDLIAFFEERGLSMTTLEGGKVFPKTQRSRDVLDILIAEGEARGVEIACAKSVTSIEKSGDEFLVACGDEAYRSRTLVIATGGRSYPATGSSGDGYSFAGALGHAIVEVGPALAPVRIRDYPFADLAGISLPGARVSIFRGKKVKEETGDVLFTHDGLSGPGILDLSRYIRAGDVLRVSFAGERRREEIDDWHLERSQKDGPRNLRSVLAELVIPARLAARVLEVLHIPVDLKCAEMTRAMRTGLADHLAGFPFVVEEVGGFDSAMATRGGVDLREINPKTMESRLVSGLYFAGEVLDVDGDSGGYNLQAAFSTGALAGRSIRKRLADAEGRP
ncbi:BaiN/RdsA family NAD(P)/FAD-dependent oxidoreductase [Candidatus Methanocrinis natronophilus]|uniref:NAD(P)/FAD-dependent oxidoreductase n=1 Tax=Candidatus Methanocrinis natronophilus TaxID=3033396 RepID=A0ABT5X9B9_9EURY|nr:NAD(P)/FAD-dependent oxidoreductase [Candidatus Methanocrinis natronophilus]MDF0591177.1 NAD(P)/FAD-dependent oxidoreductase [Candidatus Methanocrinis natronophilus]